MTKHYENWYATNPTPEELRAVLGEGWAVCRKTPRNLARYGNCVSRSEYEAARRAAMSARH